MGSIPPSLGSLTGLQQLSLAFAGLSGSIPPELGNLINLQNLNLMNNQLTGEIPASLGDLKALVTMSLLGNNLQGPIPAVLGSLPLLSYLDLAVNQLSGGLPAAVLGLPSLTVLDVTGNLLSGDIPQASIQPNLQSLSLFDNYFSGPQPVLPKPYNAGFNCFGVSKGTSVDGQRTWQVCGTFYGLAALPPTATADILALKAELGDPPELLWDEISAAGPCAGCPGNCVLNQLGCDKFGHVTYLDLSGLSYRGVIPATLAKIPSLQVLYLQFCNLQGQIPAFVTSTLLLLTDLYLGGNQLTGPIPADIGNLDLLMDLDLNNNLLTGALPATLTGCISLSYLIVTGNVLSGPVPAFIADFANYTFVYINDNEFTGPVPDSILAPDLPIFIHLENNYLTGPLLPSTANAVIDGNCLGDLTAFADRPNQRSYTECVQFFALATMPASSATPLLDLKNALGNPTELDSWNSTTPCDGCLFGTCSSWAGVLCDKHERVVFLSINLGTPPSGIVPTLPSSLTSLTSLTGLILTYTEFGGAIPADIGSLSLLTTLTLSNNLLEGAVPASISNLTLLTTLDLSNNRLSGSLPDSWATLPLGILDVHGNVLTGVIPPSYGQLINLVYVTLNVNELTGDVPLGFASLPKVRILDLADNYFTSFPPGARTASFASIYHNCFNVTVDNMPADQKSYSDCATYLNTPPPGPL
eukprot:SM000477S16935  [mRNA]  locus=s477:8737:11262:- [translate_table: standard]